MNTRARISTPFRAIRIIRELFSSFHNANVPYCHWKSNEHLSKSLIALTDLLERVHGLALASAEPWEPRKALHVHGPARLPIRFEPGKPQKL